jgi:hypothetical protein
VTGEPVAELTPRLPARADIDAEWAAWRERVRATYEAVHYTCAHRLADPSLAGAVAVQVVAGLVARPQVFRYFGLPFSGRIARLAEARLAEAAAGELATVCAWAQLRERLDAVPGAHRDALVVTCVQGEDASALAAVWSCDDATAEAGHAAMLVFMRELAGPGLAAAPDAAAPDEE